jgi:hypothetical protein
MVGLILAILGRSVRELESSSLVLYPF